MKVQNIFRTHVVTIGFAAACLFAGGASAQEIDNTVWADSSTVEPFPQSVPAAAVNDLGNATTNSVQTDTPTAIAQPGLNSEAVVSGGAASEGWLIGMSIMLMAPLAVVLLAKARRAKQSVRARALHSKESAALY